MRMMLMFEDDALIGVFSKYPTIPNVKNAVNLFEYAKPFPRPFRSHFLVIFSGKRKKVEVVSVASRYYCEA